MSFNNSVGVFPPQSTEPSSASIVSISCRVRANIARNSFAKEGTDSESETTDLSY